MFSNVNSQDVDQVILKKRVKNIASEDKVGQKKEQGGKNTREPSSKDHLAKVERSAEEGDLTLPKVPLQFRMEMQQARQKLNITQIELARKINESVDVVKKYESGATVPSGPTMGKIKRALLL
jgi:ribosome-binding protein aMBF1 (putative translation factor)